MLKIVFLLFMSAGIPVAVAMAALSALSALLLLGNAFVVALSGARVAESQA